MKTSTVKKMRDKEIVAVPAASPTVLGRFFARAMERVMEGRQMLMDWMSGERGSSRTSSVRVASRLRRGRLSTILASIRNAVERDQRTSAKRQRRNALRNSLGFAGMEQLEGRAMMAVIASDGLNNATTLFTLSGGAYYTGTTSSSADAPASAPYAVEGTHSRGVANGTATLTSSNINTSGYSSIQMQFRLASYSVGSTANGADGADIVTVEVSPDGGTNYYSTVRVLGASNARWSWTSGTGNASTAYDGNASPVNFQPASGGARTADGYSTVTITSLPATSNLRFRITLLNNDGNERWLVDEFQVTGDAASGPTITGGATATAFTTTYGAASTAQTFPISGSNLTASITATAPLGFEVSSDGTTYGSTATFTQTSGSASGTLSVRLAAAAPVSGSYNSQNIVLSSTDATSVNIVTAASGNAVSAKVLTITGLTANDKGFDGNTTVSVTGTPAYSGLVNGETSPVTGSVTWAFPDSNVGINKTLTRTGSFDAPSTNYTVTQPTLTASINAVVASAPTISGITPGNGQLSVAFTAPSSNGGVAITDYKYSLDGGAFIAVGATSSPFTISGLTNGQTYSVRLRAVNSVGDGAISDAVSGAPAAPTQPTVTVSSLSGTLTTTYGSVSPERTFTVSGATLSGNLTVAAPAGIEVSTTSGASFADSLVLTATGGAISNTTIFVRLKATAAAGNYDAATISITGGGDDKTVSTPASGNSVSQKGLTITGISIASKIYDRGTSATISGTAEYSGLVNGENFTVTGTPSASFADNLVANGKAVTVTGYTPPSGNYSITQPSGLTANITAKALTIDGAAVTTKSYDSTTSATITGTLAGVISGDTVNLVGTGTFASANAGTAIPVTSTSTITGADAANYSLTQPAGLTGDITKANQTITFAALPNKIVGDAPFDLTATTTSPLEITFTSSNPSVATISGKTVTIVGSGVTTITASQAGDQNYNAASDVQRNMTVTVTIAQWTFENTFTATAPERTSGSTGAAAIVGSFTGAVSATGTTTGEIQATGTSAWAFGTANPGTSNESSGVQFLVSTIGMENVSFQFDQRFSNTSTRTVRVQYTIDGSTWTNLDVTSANFTAGGTGKGGIDNGRIDVASPIGENRSDVWNRRTINFAGISGVNNNANFGVRVLAAHYGTTGQFRQSNSVTTVATAGTWRFDNVTFSGVTIPAQSPSITTQPSNSTITYGANTTFTAAATGTPVPTVQWQTFVGGAWTDIDGLTDGGVYSNFTTDTLTVTKPPVSLSTRTYRAVYTNTAGSAQTGSATLTVNKKALTATSFAANKVYDGNNNAAVTIDLLDTISGDVVFGSAGGIFSDKNAGTGKTVTVGTITLSGADANNYTVGSAPNAVADITRKALTITAQAKAKVGGRTDPTLTFTSSGLVTGDSVVGALTRAAGEVPGVYAITQGTVDNASNPNYDITYVGANVTITFALQINNGDAQRSMITSITLTFYEPVTLGANALTLENLGVFTANTSTIPSNQLIISPASGASTTFTITFGAGIGANGSTLNGVTKRAGGASTGTNGNTLADGNYQLTINIGSVTGGGSALAGNNVVGNLAADNFFRIYGDSNGDGRVDGADFAALRAALAAGGAYNAAFDFDGNGSVPSGLDTAEYTKRQNRRRRTW